LIIFFKTLHATARYLVARSEEDKSDVVKALVKLRWSFAVTVLQVNARFQLCKLGVGTVHAQVLVIKLQQMSEQLSAVTAPQAA
jgi:hypothetical protein